MIPTLARPQRNSEYLMIRSFEVRNFRCFEHLKVDDCGRINVIVGDNGSGKTALLEALFMPLAPTTEIAARFRQQRGLENAFSGSARAIEYAIFGDLFFQRDMTRTVIITLSGDGPEARSLTIARGGEQSGFLSITTIPGAAPSPEMFTTSDLVLTWKDAAGNSRSVRPQVAGGNIQLGSTGEDMPGFYYYASQTPTSSLENATRFSELSRKNEDRQFIETLAREYTWIEDLSIQIAGGSASIHATIKDAPKKMPLPNVSSAFNRIVAILLAIASQRKGVVLVDEMENGVYYRHHSETWRTILRFAREYECQVFTTTHSQEWLRALVEASEGDLSDIRLWRLERDDKGKPELLQFDGETLEAGIEYGSELRGVE
jgi:predicted ATPase